MKNRRIVAVPLLGLLFLAFTLSDLPPSIKSKTEFYTLDSVQPSDVPGILQFHVTTPHAAYDVKGVRLLTKLLQEIEVIEKIRRHEKGSGFFDGASASVDATAAGLGNLVTHPVQSAKGMGKAVGKLGRGVKGIFRKKGEGEKSSFGEKVLGGNERELAKEFGVDVYTTNPYLKALITKMARARMGGKGAVMVIKFLVPVAFVASVALTAGGINGAADQIVNDSSRQDLFRMNKEAFLKMGLDEKNSESLLGLPYFSPREQTYFRFYLEKLQKIPNFGALVESMLQAKSEWEARRELYEAEMAAALTEKNLFSEIKDFPEGLALMDENGKWIYVAAYDDLSDGSLRKKIAGQVTNAATVEIQNAGKIGRWPGIQTKEWACFENV